MPLRLFLIILTETIIILNRWNVKGYLNSLTEQEELKQEMQHERTVG